LFRLTVPVIESLISHSTDKSGLMDITTNLKWEKFLMASLYLIMNL
jgi:hypothetical protein